MDNTFLKGSISDLGKMDIYLMDQIQKGRINNKSKILDAGYGRGRNLEFFVKHDADIYGIDHNPEYNPIVKEQILKWNPNYPLERIITGKVEDLPYDNEEFDFVSSIAVLHFAKSHKHFWEMMDSMLRVLKKGGYLMLRMTSWHTFILQDKTESGLVELKDGLRYMLDIESLKEYSKANNLTFSDPIKTTNVDGLRTMTTVVIQK